MTPAIRLLQQTKTDHQVLSYDHDPAVSSYGQEAVDALGLDPGSVFKTLVAVLDTNEHVVAVVPVGHMLHLKSLAKAAGAKKAAMADSADAERLTGYLIGGISPLGQKRRLRTFIDASGQPLEVIHVSAGRRGVEVAVTPGDLADLLAATFHPLTSSTHGHGNNHDT